ncbi:MAG: hypothetical protein JO076_09930, partial [Verrucomicrobia bacterium]|nr:hypothetical protein [Verrucomicrobiota bacterium]
MNFLRLSCRVWFLLAVAFLFQVCMTRAQEQAPPTSPPGQVLPPPETAPSPQPRQAPIVRQIEIQYAGPATLSRQRILSNMKTTVGQPYSEQTIEDDVRALYATGLVTNVR